MAVDKTADAVNALHKTMVMLRQELAKKNHKINYLEARLNNDLEIIQTTTATNNENIEANEESEEEQSINDNHGENGFIEGTVKLGDNERFDKEQIVVKELFTDYQPFYTINLLLDKELLPI